MKPDKLFVYKIPAIGLLHASGTNVGAPDETEYIRKDALLEWAKDNLLECETSNDDADYGRIDAFKKLIDKLESL